jgi:hypothetical protein
MPDKAIEAYDQVLATWAASPRISSLMTKPQQGRTQAREMEISSRNVIPREIAN